MKKPRPETMTHSSFVSDSLLKSTRQCETNANGITSLQLRVNPHAFMPMVNMNSDLSSPAP